MEDAANGRWGESAKGRVDLVDGVDLVHLVDVFRDYSFRAKWWAVMSIL
ncbi:MAG: hypothetical protein JOZ21_04075 [Verrucomicrobia bacterium]|nr:hypothetical protein [Verrucomicrobiota bacterium]